MTDFPVNEINGDEGSDSLTKQELEERLTSHKLDNKSKKQNIESRRYYGTGVFVICSLWMVYVAVVLCFAGANKLNLSDLVLTTMLGSTTFNILGLLIIVLKYIFPPEK